MDVQNTYRGSDAYDVIDNPIEFDKKNICLKNIKNIYFIVRNKLNDFQLHGFNIFKFRKSGTSIKYNKKIIFVPKGIAAVWNKITDENGNFNVDYTDAASLYREVKSMLSKRQRKCITLFRDSSTQVLYQDLSRKFVEYN
ncbi:hypothetical protein ACR9PU_08565 [Piscirickettsia salmonis]